MPDMDRQLVYQENFKAHWDAVLPGLLLALEPHQGRIRQEDVYFALAMKQALLFTSEEGFIIFRKEPAQQAGEWELLVWWAFSNSHSSATAHYAQQIVEIAQILECKTVAFLDPYARRGYDRVMPPEWEIGFVKWVRRV